MSEEMRQMIRHVKPDEPRTKSHEEKQYLICIAAKPGDYDLWEIVIGRTNAYEFIKDNIDIIDFDRSFILVEDCNLNQRKSIYAFVKYVQDLYNDGFDIEEYIKGDWSETEYQVDNDINIMVDNSSRLSMAEMLNGEYEFKEEQHNGEA